MPERKPVQPSRRALLAGAWAATLAVVLAGCRRASSPPPPPPAPTPPPDPDAAIVGEVVRSKQRVLAQYAAVVGRYPALDKPLRWVVAEHRVHLAALVALVDENASPTSSTSAPASSTPAAAPTSRATSAVRVPPSQPAAVAALVATERALAKSRIAAAGRSSALLARTVASIGASEAVHAALLEDPR